MLRRKDREKDRNFALEVLKNCEYATLATINLDNTPYCIPISPVLVGEIIYFHCALKGKKLENINNKNQVCLSCVGRTRLVPEEFTTEYESAVVIGKAVMVDNEEEKIMALKMICQKYTTNSSEAIQKEIEKSLHRTAICKITIDQITGKSKGY